MYLSTLRRYIEALGGELVVSAKFPEGTVVPIDSLSSVPKKKHARTVGNKTAKKKSGTAKSAGRKAASSHALQKPNTRTVGGSARVRNR